MIHKVFLYWSHIRQIFLKFDTIHLAESYSCPETQNVANQITLILFVNHLNFCFEMLKIKLMTFLLY